MVPIQTLRWITKTLRKRAVGPRPPSPAAPAVTAAQNTPAATTTMAAVADTSRENTAGPAGGHP